MTYLQVKTTDHTTRPCLSMVWNRYCQNMLR